MTWAILILVLAIALFLFGAKLLKNDNPIVHKSIMVVAIILIAGSVTRLFVPHYLVSVNPMILQEMVQGMQEQQASETNREVRRFVRANATRMMQDAPILGNPNARNTIFMFTAYSCPFCLRQKNDFYRLLESRDDVRIVLLNFSIHGMMSDIPARAMIAANIQGREYAERLDALLASRQWHSQEILQDAANAPARILANVKDLAREAGLDIERLERDMHGEVAQRELAHVRQLAERFQVQGVPFVIVNDQAFPGAIPYQQIVDALR